MVQIIKPYSLGAEIGKEFGTGLSNSIKNYTQQKMNDMTKQRRALHLQKSGVPHEISNLISQYPDELQWKMLSDLGERGAFDQQQNQSGLPEGIRPYGVPGEEVQQQGPPNLGQILSQPKTEAKGKIYESANNITRAAKAATDNDIRLNEIEHLLKSGKRTNPIVYGLMKKAGYDFMLQNPTTQRLVKLQNDFISNAKDISGGRLTDNFLKTYLARLPDPSQSDEAMQAIIKDLRIFNKMTQRRKSVADEIIKKNRGRIPQNLESQIESRIGSELDNYSQHFLNEVKQEDQVFSDIEQAKAEARKMGYKTITDQETGQIINI